MKITGLQWRVGIAVALSSAPAIAFAQSTAGISNIRPVDQGNIGVFEPSKADTTPFRGLHVTVGAAFTQQWQGLQHADSVAKATTVVNGVSEPVQLIPIGHGFNNAVANMYMNAELDTGMRVSMQINLSSRHHEDTWVNDGYLLIDKSPIDNQLLRDIMNYVTVRVGDFELDYGDTHYMRTDNGNAMFNPLVGNPIMDAYTTEIGAEIYVRANGFLAMISPTGGEVHGEVQDPQQRSVAWHGKLGFDKQLDTNVRVRLTGSFYETDNSASNTLFTGDRAGSRYYDVMENVGSDEQDQAWSGELQPGFTNRVHAEMLNPFVKIQDLELFGEIQTATGKATIDPSERTLRQDIAQAVYRFDHNQFYVAARYNTVNGEVLGIPNDVNVNRYQVGGGWFLTKNLLSKIEYVDQKYNDFPITDIRHNGEFKGFMVEGTVAY